MKRFTAKDSRRFQVLAVKEALSTATKMEMRELERLTKLKRAVYWQKHPEEARAHRALRRRQCAFLRQLRVVLDEMEQYAISKQPWANLVLLDESVETNQTPDSA